MVEKESALVESLSANRVHTTGRHQGEIFVTCFAFSFALDLKSEIKQELFYNNV
jgi:hypothetical protein